MKNKLLSWYIFYRLDAVPDGQLTPDCIESIVDEFDKMDRDSVIRLLKAEFSPDDLQGIN